MRATQFRCRFLPMVGFAAVALATPALAADDAGRFSMTPTDKGFLRLDKQTGEVSVCADKGGKFSCESVADTRALMQTEIDRLAKENGELRAENKRLEDVLGLGEDKNKRAQAPNPNKDKGFKLPTEQDIDRAMDEISRLVKKFKDKMKDLGAEERGERL